MNVIMAHSRKGLSVKPARYRGTIHPSTVDSEHPEVLSPRQGQNMILPVRVCNDIQVSCPSGQPL